MSSPTSQIIFFRDVTEVSTYREKYYDEQIVLGLANFDNYEESVQYADEADTTAITAAVRTPLVEYCNQHGVLARRLNNQNKYLLILNEKRFAELAADHFSIQIVQIFSKTGLEFRDTDPFCHAKSQIHHFFNFIFPSQFDDFLL